MDSKNDLRTPENPANVLDRHEKKLRKYPHVLNLAIANKFVEGKDTGKKSIVFYVDEKVPKKLLAEKDQIPKEIEGIPTDVVEIHPKTWTAGETSISRLSPKQQRRRLGVRRD